MRKTTVEPHEFELLYSRNKWHMLCSHFNLSADESSAATFIDRLEAAESELSETKLNFKLEREQSDNMRERLSGETCEVEQLRVRLAEQRKAKEVAEEALRHQFAGYVGVSPEWCFDEALKEARACIASRKQTPSGFPIDKTDAWEERQDASRKEQEG